MRLTKIYTRKGDQGYTVLGHNRISKDDLLVEAVGTIDELNSCIGVVISLLTLDKESDNKIEEALTRIQNELFDMGGEFHVPEHPAITSAHVTSLEKLIDTWNKTLPPLKEFLLPRGNPSAAACHVARTVCRRAERTVVKRHRQVSLSNPEILRYLNRLSDVLFVAARILGHKTNEKELMWDHERKR